MLPNHVKGAPADGLRKSSTCPWKTEKGSGHCGQLSEKYPMSASIFDHRESMCSGGHGGCLFLTSDQIGYDLMVDTIAGERASR